MNKWQRQVAEFHEATGSTIGETLDIRDRELRAKLIMEEAVETVAALGYTVTADIFSAEAWSRNDAEGDIGSFTKTFKEPDLIEVIDGLCDLTYVVTGTAVAMGFDMDPHYEEVHRANMTKPAGPKREDGKQLKPEGWRPPAHDKIIERQRAREEEWKRMEEAWTQQGMPEDPVNIR